MVNDPGLLLRAKQRCPNSYQLVRLVSERARQLGKGEMNGDLFPRLVHRALEEAASRRLRPQPAQPRPKGTVDLVGAPEELEGEYAHT